MLPTSQEERAGAKEKQDPNTKGDTCHPNSKRKNSSN